ncbi:MAG TPA: glutamate-5-semialdehyde dehydrogenase, partial [Candidatus Binataceae bacterium]|nr:glutamate-5-semialdehyde dehydrogenase [Candidatus Binataceae bacterium]
MSLETELLARLTRLRAAAPTLALAGTADKNRALVALARAIRGSRETIAGANLRDLQRARAANLAGAFVERLTLNDTRIEAMAASVEQVATLPDPVGRVIEQWQRPNGLRIRKVGVPLGVIAMIYESRPNVTVDAASLCIKSGNAVALRGGKEAFESNRCLAGLVGGALESAGIDPDCVYFVDNTDRETIQLLKRRPELIDVIIPRGGNTLKEALAGSAVPLMPHFDGRCHTYVDSAADLKMAEEICLNAKCSRPSVCNAMENLLVHAAVAARFLPSLGARFKSAGVELRADERAL